MNIAMTLIPTLALEEGLLGRLERAFRCQMLATRGAKGALPAELHACYHRRNDGSVEQQVLNLKV